MKSNKKGWNTNTDFILNFYMWKRFKNLRKNKAKPPTIKTCSRRNRKMFANNFEKVREQFAKSSRTIFSFFANTVLNLFEPPEGTDIKQLLSRGSQLLTSTKCTSVPHGSYSRAPRVLHPCLTSPITAFHVPYFRFDVSLLPIGEWINIVYKTLLCSVSLIFVLKGLRRRFLPHRRRLPQE